MNTFFNPLEPRTHILIVEDSPTQAEHLKYILEVLQYRVTHAANGVQALALLRSESFDLVISDIVMPEMDGYQLCKAIKSDPSLRGVPVILLTALSDPHDIINGLMCGADNFVTKPYDEKYLLARIRFILANRNLHNHENTEMGIEVVFAGQKYFITSARQQILNLLLSTFETAIDRNYELMRARDELRTLNEQLEKRVEERTAALTAENAERKYAEAQLQSAQERLHYVISSSPAIIYSVKIEGSLFVPQWVSNNVLAVTGYAVEECLSPTWWPERVHPEDRSKRIPDPVLMLTKDHHALEYRFLMKDGSYRWVRDEFVIIRDTLGEPVEMIGSWVDITEKINLEGQLFQAQKMQAIGQLAGGVAHDFNNLLMVINWCCQSLLNSISADNPQIEDVQEIQNAAERAASLTRQLLAFSRKQVLQPAPTNLNLLIGNVKKMLSRLIGEHIEIRTNLSPDLNIIQADPGQIEQVVINLSVNARDAMPEGGTLTIETANIVFDEAYANQHLETLPGAYVMLAVSDTGSGMGEEIKAKIFEPFFTTKEPGRGTGLGLATVHGIVKQSGGHIWVYSESGHGTTFKIYFPVAEGQKVKPSVLQPKRAIQGNETLLLVEDNEHLRTLAEHVLQKYGYTVLSASDGLQALDLSDQYPGTIHMLITDVIMPRMGGKELSNRIGIKRPRIIVLFMSGYTDNSILQNGILDEMAAYLQKPCSPEALLAKVREMLDEGKKE